MNHNQYECEVCEDRGGVVFELPIDDPMFGKLQECPMECKAVQENRKRLLAIQFKESNLNDSDKQYSFQNWLENLTPEQQVGKVAAYIAACYIVDRKHGLFSERELIHDSGLDVPDTADERPKNNIIFVGPLGTGKTRLAKTIVNECTWRGIPAIYNRAKDMIEDILAGYNDATDYTFDTRKHDYINVDVLVIDEFEARKLSDTALDLIESIIRRRTDEVSRRTIITANLAPEVMAMVWGVRTASPLQDKAHWIEVGGVSLRRKANVIKA